MASEVYLALLSTCYHLTCLLYTRVTPRLIVPLDSTLHSGLSQSQFTLATFLPSVPGHHVSRVTCHEAIIVHKIGIADYLTILVQSIDNYNLCVVCRSLWPSFYCITTVKRLDITSQL